MEKFSKHSGITLVALVITIIILLILAGITISSISGENGLIAKVNQSKKAHIKAEMKETLILAINELQLEKDGKATLDDITQEWADNALENYNPQITSDSSTNGKKVRMKKDNVRGKYIIDEKLNITELENDSSIEFSYDVGKRKENKIEILIHVQDEENGLSKIELPYEDPIIVEGDKKREIGIDYEVEIGKEYIIKITPENGQTQEETILLTDYWCTITKDLGEGVEIDNPAIKAAYNKKYEAKITTGDEYILETISVTMDGQEVTTSGNNVIDVTTGEIKIEKVTGNIEIKATAIKLEINTTTPIVSTSTSATSSTPSNKVAKGTPVYIKFTATLNITGGICTIDKTIPYEVSSNGTYTFTVTGTYESKITKKEIEVKVDQYQSAPNLVQYDAGDWTESEIQSLKAAGLYNLNASKIASSESGLNYTFGGFTYNGDTENSSYINNGTIITSRNQSVAPQDRYGTPKYDGWQILEIKDSSGNIVTNETEVNSKLDNLTNEKIYVTKLVHSGCPENFVYYHTTNYDNKKAEYILSSGLRQQDYNTYNPRNWQMYVDKNQESLIADITDKDGNLIKNIHAMTYNEAVAITGSEDMTNGLRNTGSFYWLGNIYNREYFDDAWLYVIHMNGDATDGSRRCFGIRPVVSLKSGVYIASGTGTDGDPYILAME